MVDAADLKSATSWRCVGSNPSLGTNFSIRVSSDLSNVSIRGVLRESGPFSRTNGIRVGLGPQTFGFLQPDDRGAGRKYSVMTGALLALNLAGVHLPALRFCLG